jgi:hypothetical protein
LKDVEIVTFPSGPVIVVSIESPRRPSAAIIGRFEALLHERLSERNVRVVVRVAESVDVTSKGRVLFGEAHFGRVSEEAARRQRAVEEAVRHDLKNLPDVFVTALDAVFRDSAWAVRAEVVAPHVLKPSDVHAVEERATKTLGEPVALTVRASTEILVTGTRYRAAGSAGEQADSAPASEPRSR